MNGWREQALRYAILFGVSVLLVAGFWFHSEFYQVGLYGLLLAGGFATFLVLVLVKYAITGSLSPNRPRGSLVFALEDGERMIQRRASAAILPADAPVPPVGSVASARFETGAEFAQYRIADAYRKHLGDLDAAEVQAAGFRDLDELRRVRQARGGWRPEAVVLVARLRPARGVGP